MCKLEAFYVGTQISILCHSVDSKTQVEDHQPFANKFLKEPALKLFCNRNKIVRNYLFGWSFGTNQYRTEQNNTGLSDGKL